jgi:hypothetical protein
MPTRPIYPHPSTYSPTHPFTHPSIHSTTTMNARILLVEDEEKLVKFVQLELSTRAMKSGENRYGNHA